MKARIQNLYNKIFFTPQLLPAGSCSSTVEIEGKSNRLFLRTDHEGNGILVVNASTVLHLNPTAAEIAYYLIKQMPVEDISAELVKRYRVSAETARQDIEELKVRVNSLMETPDLDPETFLDMDRAIRHSSEQAAPLRLDCALTYQIPSGQSDMVTPNKRVDRPLQTEEWQLVLDKAWEWGIPHVVFTGGEPTMRPDLVELIQYAENLGQVTGLITDGLRLVEKDYLEKLLSAGLDHLMIVLRENEELTWEAIRDVLNEDIHLTVHVTITKSNKEMIGGLLEKISSMGVPHVSISAPSKEYEPALMDASRMAAEKGLSLIYDLPVPYTEMNPVSLELEEDATALEGYGRSWLYVEPDGDVLPGQGILKNLGNFIKDPWMAISANQKLYLAR